MAIIQKPDPQRVYETGLVVFKGETPEEGSKRFRFKVQIDEVELKRMIGRAYYNKNLTCKLNAITVKLEEVKGSIAEGYGESGKEEKK